MAIFWPIIHINYQKVRLKTKKTSTNFFFGSFYLERDSNAELRRQQSGAGGYIPIQSSGIGGLTLLFADPNRICIS